MGNIGIFFRLPGAIQTCRYGVYHNISIGALSNFLLAPVHILIIDPKRRIRGNICIHKGNSVFRGIPGEFLSDILYKVMQMLSILFCGIH